MYNPFKMKFQAENSNMGAIISNGLNYLSMNMGGSVNKN